MARLSIPDSASGRDYDGFYWDIGRRIVEFEQGGQERAPYGEGLLKRLSADLSNRCGRGFGVVNLQQIRLFYQAWPLAEIQQTAPDKSPALTGITSSTFNN